MQNASTVPVFPLCGFSLSLFCNYCARCMLLILQELGAMPPQARLLCCLASDAVGEQGVTPLRKRASDSSQSQRPALPKAASPVRATTTGMSLFPPPLPLLDPRQQPWHTFGVALFRIYSVEGTISTVWVRRCSRSHCRLFCSACKEVTLLYGHLGRWPSLSAVMVFWYLGYMKARVWVECD